jgi:hypothetical protein
VAFVGLPTTLLLLWVASDPEMLREFGVFAEQRVVGSEAMWTTGQAYMEDSPMRRATFPILYLLSETSGVSADSWARLDASSLRGFLALPWIALVVPSFLLGLRWLATTIPGARSTGGALGRLVATRMLASPWSVLIVFVCSSFLVSWIVGDTTRWRLADMPVVAAIAIAPWLFGSARKNVVVLALWLFLAGVAFAGYYLLSAF